MNALDRMAHMYGDVVEGHTRRPASERIKAALSAADPEGLALAGRVAATGGTGDGWRYVVTLLRSSVMIYR